MFSKSTFFNFFLLMVLGLPCFGQFIDNNDLNCDLGLTIPDDACDVNELELFIGVSGEVGTQLGTDIILEQVDIIINHTWVGDVRIGLLSPIGEFVRLSRNNGGDGVNYGDPSDCPNTVLSFRMNSDNEIEDAPDGNLTGIFRPEGDFEDFNDGSDPNGIWTLLVCDDDSPDEGTLEYVKLTFATPPANDQCGNAIPITCGESVIGTNVNATNDPNAGECENVTNQTGGGVWYTWIGDGSCVNVTTCSPLTSADFDSKISIYEGTCGALVCVASDDDEEGCPESEFFSSESFNSVIGTQYFILVHGFSYSAGVFELTLTCGGVPNDDVCNATAIDVGVPVIANGFCATAQLGEVDPGIGSSGCDSQDGWCDISPEPVIDNSLWYSFIAPPSGKVNIETTSDDDPQMALWSVGDCNDFGTFTEIAANDDGDEENFSPRIDDLCLVPGQTYFIQIDGFEGDDYIASIIINDVGATPLAINCPASVTIECPASSDPANTGSATANTNDCCSEPPTIASSDVTINGHCPYNYSIDRTWTATYLCGAEFSCHQIITIQDGTDPIIACPVEITVSCSDSTDPANTGEAIATDNCAAVGEITITLSDASTQTASGCGQYTYTITRTWTATDNCNNSTSCDQTIQVQDIVKPDISCPSVVTVSCTDSTDPVDTGEATATDNCAAMDEITITPSDASTQTASGCGKYNYTITRTWTATDNCNNSNSCDQIINVEDIEGPTMVCTQDVITITPDAEGSYTFSPLDLETYGAGTTDNCGAVSFSISQPTITCADEGLQDLTLSAIDECGNPSSCIVHFNVLPYLIIHSCVPTDVSCAGAGNGAINIVASALGGQLMYSVDGGINWQLVGDFYDLTPGTYNIVVKVFGIPNICEKTDTKVINVGPAPFAWYLDTDNDGYYAGTGIPIMSCSQPSPGYSDSALPGDCDDFQDSVYPNAPELCDGLDNDCDGVVPGDEIDDDGDGQSECEGDCDDANAAVYTGATEICDGLDNDCNGMVDDGVSATYVGNVMFTSQAQLDAWSACYTIIQGNVTIQGATVTNLGPLSNITTITGNVMILMNSGLTSLDGLENLATVGGAYYMYYNFQLIDCCAIDDLLTNAGIAGPIVIFYNNGASHCNSAAAIMAACPVMPLVGNPNNGTIATGEAVTLQGGRKMAIYPNPASQEVNVLFDRTAPTATLRIMDMLGRVVYEMEMGEGMDRMSIDLNRGQFENGLYLVSLFENGEMTTKQLVVQK